MATNPAAKRMSNPTKRNKRIGNEARNENVPKRVQAFMVAYGLTIDSRIHTVTAFRHAMRQAKRIAFRPLIECFVCDGKRMKAQPKSRTVRPETRLYRCLDCGTESVRF